MKTSAAHTVNNTIMIITALITCTNSFKEIGQKWLGGSFLPEFMVDEREALRAPITQEEIEQAIFGLTFQKAPGPDRYTAEFLKILNKEISPSLNMPFNYYKEPQSQNI